MTTTAERILIRRNYSLHDDATIDTNLWPYHAVGPPVVVILFMHLVTPPCIYDCILRSLKRRTKNDEKENKAIAAKYKKKLEKLKNRTPKLPNDVMIRELYEIQQQLKNEFDQLLSRRRQRDRKRTKTREFSRVYSFCVYLSFLLGMIYLGIKFGHYAASFEVSDGFIIIILIFFGDCNPLRELSK